MTLNGIDVSSHQYDTQLHTYIDLTRTTGDFVIVKATEGTGYRNPAFTKHAQQAQAAGKLLGLYHYLKNGDPIAQADYFLSAARPYIGQAILVVDIEDAPLLNQTGPDNGKRFLDRIRAATGITGFVYTYLNEENHRNWTKLVAAGYPLWLAQYNFGDVRGYIPRPLNGKLKNWPAMTIFQYTSTGYLPGWRGRLDFNVFYGTKADWQKWATGKAGSTPGKTVPAKPAPTSPTVATAKPATAAKPAPPSTAAKPATAVKPATTASNWHSEKGTFTLNRAIILREGPSTSAKAIATLQAGQKVSYNAFTYSGGYVWIRQPRSGGKFGYMATGTASGTKRTSYWGSFS
ncbi:GH25 family lysozyme [Lacticaseibacillus mingshuiensis]|uniref:GH25 family lysozyme n=1 Tax=Lacticaseibacillus mingshuiensis TaxID=2799574 RepID=A0ABW4CJS9_9LACO|nr:GH25 family lysozyme [Lacticaseibacillus mingshuiensis]